MGDLFGYLAALQGEIVRSLAVGLRSGGLATAALAFALGALHALTPGHGKAALATYFLGTEARLAKGVAVALWAALLHVLSGFVVFLVLRSLVGRSPFAMGRPSAGFSSATVEHGPMPSAVRSAEFHVVISTALSDVPT